MPFSVFLILCTLEIASVKAQIAPSPPVPEWMALNSANTNGVAVFAKTFTTRGELLKGILLGACDGRMSVHLNGQMVGEIAGTNRASGVDVTRAVRTGTNVLMLRSEDLESQPRLSVMLELNHDLAKVDWIASDRTWTASTNAWLGFGPGTSLPIWQSVQVLGRVDATGSINPFDSTNAFDAYNSWKLALKANAATDPAGFMLLPGFKAELLRSAQPGEGSWVSMAFDPKGRLTLAREKAGLIRLTLRKQQVEMVEVINNSLLECRGLLYAHNALFVNANNSRSFYRLRDTDGNDRFDEIKLLLKTEGNVGHGRNHVVLGPDGAIWLVHGNNVTLPKQIAPDSPLQHYQTDSLIPCPFDDALFDGDVSPPAGHIIRTDAEGKKFQLFAGGFRNPLDIAFNRDGEMFTFDADMEWDVGSPWYRPNRVNHVISGADFGWRRGTSKFPDYFPETFATTVDIGLASPTGIEFGTKSHFPAPYNDALFIADWAYGRVLAVHLKAKGATYTGSSELFVSGRPLNVTDLTFGPDGAMYLITGGRTTQSGLYRISYTGPQRGPVMSSRKELAVENRATQARRLRHGLESYHASQSDRSAERAVDFIWPRLGHPDPAIRHAARVALEHQPLSLWQRRALTETNTDVALNAWMALVHVGKTNVQPQLLGRLLALPLSRLDDGEALQAYRLFEVACARFGKPPPDRLAGMREKLGPLYPGRDWRLNHRLCVLLVYLEEKEVIPKTLQLLGSAERPEDFMQYLFYLRYAQEGWTSAHREEWMRGMARAEQKQGARDYYSVLKRVRDEFLKGVSPEEAQHLAMVQTDYSRSINGGAGAPQTIAPLKFVKEWHLEDFDLSQPLANRSLEQGKATFRNAQCVLCHRFGSEGAVVGPDLTAVASRFDRKTLLESMIDPSKVIDEKFRNINFILKDGNVITGSIDREDNEKIYVRENPLAPAVTEVRKENVTRRELSAISPMPAGLLNPLEKEQILDLLAYLERGVNLSETKR